MIRISTSPSDPAATSPPPVIPSTVRRTVLAYHELCSEAIGYRYALSSCQFEQHLQLVARLQNSFAPDKQPLTVSFDDGHISNYTHALPLLEKYSCKAVFFVIAGRIGAHQDSMTWAHLRELVSLGYQVESHSWSHKFLTECHDSELRDELVRSKETLEDRLGNSVQGLSAPHGRWNGRVLKACSDAGYSRLYTSDPWSATRGMKQGEVIGRLVMVQAMDVVRLLHWLSMGRARAGLQRTQYILKHSARQILGNKLYYRLWARFSGWHGPDDTMLNGNHELPR